VKGGLYISKERFPTSGNDKKPLSSFPVVIPALVRLRRMNPTSLFYANRH